MRMLSHLAAVTDPSFTAPVPCKQGRFEAKEGICQQQKELFLLRAKKLQCQDAYSFTMLQLWHQDKQLSGAHVTRLYDADSDLCMLLISCVNN